MWSKAQRLLPRGAAIHPRWRPVASAAPAARPRAEAPLFAGLFDRPVPADAPTIEEADGADEPTVEDRLADAHAQGVAHGREVAERAFAEERERLLSTVRDITALRRQVLGAAEHDVMQLAVGMARRVLHREVQLDPDILLSMAHVALGRLGDRPVATIRLHPEDLATINQQAVIPEGVTLVADQEVPRGGCRIVSSSGEIDLGVDAQMTELSRVLLGELSSVDRAHLH